MAQKKDEAAKAALVSVKVTCFYGDAVAGDTVEVDAEEADRLVKVGAGSLVQAAAQE